MLIYLFRRNIRFVSGEVDWDMNCWFHFCESVPIFFVFFSLLECAIFQNWVLVAIISRRLCSLKILKIIWKHFENITNHFTTLSLSLSILTFSFPNPSLSPHSFTSYFPTILGSPTLSVSFIVELMSFSLSPSPCVCRLFPLLRYFYDLLTFNRNPLMESTSVWKMSTSSQLMTLMSFGRNSFGQVMYLPLVHKP